MTPEDIKKIAEEYAMSRYEGYGGLTRRIIAAECETILHWLAERYYLVDKGRAMREYEGLTFLSEKHPKPSERKAAKKAAFELEALFGHDIRKGG